MTKKTTTILLLSAVLAIAFVLVYHPAHANTIAGTSQGVTLLVLACAPDPFNGQVFGPGHAGVNGGYCDGEGQMNFPQLPSGTLYNLRATVTGGTTDSTPAPLTVNIYSSGSRIPVLACQTTTRTNNCQDLTHKGSIIGGETLSATVSIPDSITWVSGVTITVEENIIE